MLTAGGRSERGTFLPSSLTVLERFAAKCRFDPLTGCVLWTGGTTNGKGNSAVYGSFKDGKDRWSAHRWAAVHIHGFDITGLTVGHCCHDHRPGPPNSLCVQHVKPETLAANIAERNTRVAKTNRAVQTSLQRQFWLFVDRGLEPSPYAAPEPDPNAVPWYDPPAWFLPFMPEVFDCPF